jgi:hypothetical protein
MKFNKQILAFAVLAGLAGCGGSGNGVLNIPNPRIIPVNAFDGVPTANFEVGTDTSVTPVAFGTAGDAIITVNGTKDVSAGATTFNDLVTLPSQLFEQSQRYTVVGYGGSGSRALGVFQNNKSQSASTTVSFRAINGSANAASVDVYVTNSADGNTLPATPEVSALALGAASAYVTLPDSSQAITIRVRVFAAGDRTTALADTTFNLDDRERVSLVTFDSVSPSVGVLNLQDNL